MAELSSGVASVPQRNAAMVEPVGGALLAMPAYVPGAGALAAKLVGQFPQNPARGLPSHVALIAAFDPETGVPQAVMDGEVITAARTAAGSALSARLLARADAAVLAILGTGVQARSHGRALARVRSLGEVRVEAATGPRPRRSRPSSGPSWGCRPRLRRAIGRRSRAPTSCAPAATPPRRWSRAHGSSRGCT